MGYVLLLVTVQSPDTIFVIASASEAISRDRHVRAPFDGAGLAMTLLHQKTELLLLLPTVDKPPAAV